jgi:hypothetical protein
MSEKETPMCLLMDHIPRFPCSHYMIRLHYRIIYVLKELTAEARASKGGTCVWRVAKSGMGPPEIAMGMSCGWILRLRMSTWF